MKLRIVSDGIQRHTRILDEEGREIEGVVGVIIQPIRAGKDAVRVSVELEMTNLDVTAYTNEKQEAQEDEHF